MYSTRALLIRHAVLKIPAILKLMLGHDITFSKKKEYGNNHDALKADSVQNTTNVFH